MDVVKNIVISLFTLTVLDICVQPVYSNTTKREVVIVSEKKYIKPEHIVGLDTYDKPINYYVKEQYILRFKNRNGFFTINKELFNDTWLGRKFIVKDELLYFCRSSIDRCDSFE